MRPAVSLRQLNILYYVEIDIDITDCAFADKYSRRSSEFLSGSGHSGQCKARESTESCGL